MEGLLWKGRRDCVGVKPLLLRAGIAIAFSFASYLFFQIHPRLHGARQRLPSPGRNEVGRRSAGGLKEELRLIKIEEASPKATGCITTSAFVVLSPMSRSSADEEGFLLPEFNQLVVKEFELSTREPDSPMTYTLTPKKWDNHEKLAMEQEISDLKNKVQLLQERERKLEMQLLEYYGLREQETSLRELENRLKINAVEAKLFSLKIDSLQADNRRLEAQVSDYSKVTADLESAKGKIKLLKWKLRSNSERANEEVAALQQRFVELQENECKDKECREELKHNLMRLKDLEDETMELRKENSQLAQHNLDLIKRLESFKALESTAHEDPEAGKASEEVDELRQQNEDLKKKIEQLQVDRCTDAEELVYLKWVNACLRYELRNYQVPTGKTVARDLSKTLSPKSEEKAKQLILQYANTGNDDKMLTDFDLEYCSSSQASSRLGTGELDDSSTSTKNSGHSSKIKFFAKLKKLVLRKDAHSSRSSSSGRTSTSFASSERRRSVYSYSSDDLVGLGSEYSESIASHGTMDSTPGKHLRSIGLKTNKAQWDCSLSRSSLDSSKLSHMSPDESQDRISDCSSGYKRFVLGEGSSVSSPRSMQLDCDSIDFPEKTELKKLANALRDSRLPPRFHQRAGSFELY